MTSTMPALGWAGTLGLSAIIVLLVCAIVLYHAWLDRRVKAERRDDGTRGPR